MMRSVTPSVQCHPQNQHQAKRTRTTRDRLSHRIIEKRRRDRMNSCLSELYELLPSTYIRKNQGRIEKNEIIEMGTKYLKSLKKVVEEYERRFQSGYFECRDEVMRYLVEKHGCHPQNNFCEKLLQHLKSRLAQLLPLSELNTLNEPIASRGSDCADMFQEGFDKCRDEVLKFVTEEMNQNSAGAFCADLLRHLKAHRETLVSRSTDVQGEDCPMETDGKQFYKQTSLDSRSVVSSLNESYDNSENGKDTRPGSSESSSTSSLPTVSDRLSGQESEKQSSYKFKTAIKQRFTAASKKTWQGGERVTAQPMAGSSSSENSSEVSCRWSSSSSNTGHSWSASTATSISRESGKMSAAATSTGRVNTAPGFVLHPSGSFYVPLMMVIDPSEEGFEKTDETFCHLVNIPVNFSTCNQNVSQGLLTSFTDSWQPWQNQDPTVRSTPAHDHQ